MNDDLLPKVYDENGNRKQLELDEMLSLYSAVLRMIYLDIMVKYPILDHERFKRGHTDFVGSVLDALDSTYADHIEGLRRDFVTKRKEDG